MDKVYSGRAVGALVYLPLGLYCLAVLVVTPFWIEDIWWYLVLVELPFAFVTLLVLANGYASWESLIHIRNEGLTIRAPQWRACPLPPVTRLHVPWSAVSAIRHRVENYRIPPFFSQFPVHVYAIETAQGRAVFGGRYGLKLDEALRAVAAMARVPITDEGEVEPGLIATLTRGPADWNPPRRP